MKNLLFGILWVAFLAGCSSASTATPPAVAPSAIPASATQASVPAPAAAASVAPAALAAPSATAPPSAPVPPATAPATTQPAANVPSAAPQPAATRVVAPAGQIALPPGFGISVFASGLANPRNIAFGPDGQLYVANRSAGQIVRLPDANRDGVSDGTQVVASGLNLASSLAFNKDGSLYVSTPTQVFRLSQPDANGAFQKRDLVIDGLPGLQDHFTRTLLFSPDWKYLFIQVGSSCNICIESDPRRAAILRYNADGSGGEVYAKGLRNAVGIMFRPGTNELWATNNGSDNLGDNIPPDTVQIVQQGQDYGWPRCHAGTIVDPQFGGSNGCNGVAKPVATIQAHSAALGLAFYTGKQFPADYQGDLFVALHGSMYRSVPTGYKIVRIHFTNGQPGPVQDFATGWINGAWGRPADVTTGPDGSLYMSDDHGGVIYRIFYNGG